MATKKAVRETKEAKRLRLNQQAVNRRAKAKEAAQLLAITLEAAEESQAEVQALNAKLAVAELALAAKKMPNLCGLDYRVRVAIYDATGKRLAYTAQDFAIGDEITAEIEPHSITFTTATLALKGTKA